MKACPYKDAKPEKTIQNIRDILIDNQIFTIEKYWINNLNTFYSCRVEIDGLGLGTNGKGLTEKYALASAYGEFMERIQNHILFPRVEFSPEDQNKYGFRIEPTEKKILINETGELPTAFQKAKPFNDDETLFDFWNRCRENTPVNYEVILTPYYYTKKDKVEYLPFHFMQSFYRSNGMCAGNSPEEALVQGFAEIFERYSMKYIYFKEITPPTINAEYLEKRFPEQYQMIKLIENFNKYKIIVKDCSLGLGLPVVAVVFIDLRNNSCAVKYGSDPEINIAIERCLTELLQGADIFQVNKLMEIDLSPFDILRDPDNFRTMMTIGKGRLSNSFFYDQPSYEFNEFNLRSFYSMKDKLQYSINFAITLGYDDIYIKDNSFLGFSAYQIIIPGLSEAFKISEKRREMLLRPIRIAHSLSSLDQLHNDELSRLALDMETYRAAHDQNFHFPLGQYFCMPNDGDKEWNKLTLEFIMAIIYYKLGNIAKAHYYISMYIDFIRNTFKHVNLDYHYCVREYFTLSDQQFSREKIDRILKGLYDNSIVNQVMMDLSDKSKLFQFIPLPTCWDCDSCFLNKSCYYTGIKTLYFNLKEKYKNTPIDQLNVRSAINGRNS
jgi:ribosomal protein S12 methylthiotransferase accessory factor